jgi:rubrerythrin
MPVSQITPENGVIVKNLQTAFESESNAHTQYTAYAVKADCEGLRGTANLLWAIARSEQIHANNHARVIRQLGGEPKAQIQQVEVKSTLENLVAALGDEIYEIDSMYPRFLVENWNADNSAARTFTWALEAEKTHARLLSEEIKRLEAGSASPSADVPLEFYVRPVCGYISRSPEQQRCWVCPRYCATFETVR